MAIIKRGKAEIMNIIPESTKLVDDEETRQKIKEAKEKKDNSK